MELRNAQGFSVAFLLNVVASLCLVIKSGDIIGDSEMEAEPRISRIENPLLRLLLEKIVSSVEQKNAANFTVPDQGLPSVKSTNERRAIEHQSCVPRPVVVSTYTQEKGVQTPNAVPVNRCLGGIRNPENHQCQPSKVVLKCFATLDENGRRDFIGVRSHEACEERCICARKECSSQEIYQLICPTGFASNKNTCKCDSLKGESIFYRNMGIIEDWDRDLHLLCRQQQQQHEVEDGGSFTVSVAFR